MPTRPRPPPQAAEGAPVDASVHQMLGSLTAMADQSTRDMASLRQDIAALSGVIQKRIDEAILPLGLRLDKVEATLSETVKVVDKWKAWLALLAAFGAIAGFGIGHLIDIKKFVGASQ